MGDFTSFMDSPPNFEGKAPKPVEANTVNLGSKFTSFMDAMPGAAQKAGITPIGVPSGSRSSYEDYNKKLLAKEGGGKYTQFTGGYDVPSLVRMSTGQVKQMQNTRPPMQTAVGGFQMIKDTLEFSQKLAGVRDTDVFNEDTQHRLNVALTKYNEGYAKDALKLTRDLTDGERYAMHFMGAKGGATLLKALKTSPNAKFKDIFPKAYKNNMAMFKNRGGDGVTVAGAMAELEHRMQ
jgi:hypothetical protein